MGSQTQARGFWETEQCFPNVFWKQEMKKRVFRSEYAERPKILCEVRFEDGLQSTEAVGRSAASMRVNRLGGTKVHERIAWEMERFPERV